MPSRCDSSKKNPGYPFFEPGFFPARSPCGGLRLGDRKLAQPVQFLPELPGSFLERLASFLEPDFFEQQALSCIFRLAECGVFFGQPLGTARFDFIALSVDLGFP